MLWQERNNGRYCGRIEKRVINDELDYVEYYCLVCKICKQDGIFCLNKG